ncbi:MAG TPA: trigger factor [Paracoccaceae bacterium]|nr:trigger factor [Paracoccaceae bacterium]
MQVVETKSEGLERAYALTLPAEALAEKMNAKLEAARADVQMKGFRKGKAPLPLLKKMFGKSILGEVVQETVDGAVRKHFEDTGDRPALQPDVKIANEEIDESEDLKIEISYEKLPEVPEADVSSITIERPVVEVEDGAVEEALGNLAENAQDFEEKEGAAEEGDQIVVDFVGKLEGEPFEGGAADDFPLVIGSGQFIPGFEPQLVGLSAGDEKAVEVAFPEDYQAEQLAGQAAVFDVTVKEVRKPKAAEIDDALAQRYGAEDLESLKSQIRERLAEEYRSAARQVAKRRLLDAIDELVSFELPPTLVDVEAKQIAHQMWHEENPEHQGHDHPEIEPTEEQVKLAERRVRLGLFLAEVGSRNDIAVTDQEINQSIMSRARQMGVPEKAFFDYVRQNEGALQQIRAPIFEEKVVDYLLELAQVEDKPMTKDELQSELEAMDEAPG